ncbi:hypothetical protein YYC_02173 [Plasmodium yoelii 17X]|uniref:Myosin essential light chain ELC n=4 Tax=Plasmodium yoelii TaxID=5861 RepID=A0AAE9WS83_PLAYO|nr:myosin essential light chain ELC, putative [Plasmodium yoelii]EAA22111.1 hypothetical protein [Plasmodium yoelii yoelii]ETB60821.1 hypothetical protein YYC_02173 [Plasmodium yoelii 17X]WBY55523.1 myosin essential light chain ELC [Plasmodium yoelii yoelii]CDU16617.1 conserved Plasmodium protein, unknown function [Plasmodium yoelii]VTZ74058.1 myosin essential light chain ELC, putative [Plasmodium yoelii]|eukprot:XP_730546.1 myosin essential light chain ELC, putative [Plasmodium yoelii]
MEDKFREAFILFSSCNDTLELYQFYELAHSFGIILTEEEKNELPITVPMSYWLDFANKHYNRDDPLKHVKSVNDNANIKIKIDNFVGVMSALDTRLTDKDINLLLKITNPNNEDSIDLKSISQRLEEVM